MSTGGFIGWASAALATTVATARAHEGRLVGLSIGPQAGVDAGDTALLLMTARSARAGDIAAYLCMQR